MMLHEDNNKIGETAKSLCFLALFLALACLCWQKLGCDVRNDATLGDNNVAEEFSKSGRNYEHMAKGR